MGSNDTDNRVNLKKPPTIMPRSSSLGRTNGQEHVKEPLDSESINSGSDGEKERVREKLKKTSLAGIRSESQSRESATAEANENSHEPQTASTEAREASPEVDSKMDESDDKSEMSDASSTSSQGSRKRARDADDDGEDASSDVDNDTAPRPPLRKRSRELSDGPEGRKLEKEPLDAKSEDADMEHAHPDVSGKTTESATTPPPTKMDEDTVTSPGRRLDGRKRVREEGDTDALEENVKIKKSMVKDGSEEETTKENPMGHSAGTLGTGDALASPTQGISRQGTPIDMAKSATPEPAKIAPGSGFANTSAISPFATAATSAKPLFGGASSGTLFANSKFGAMSSSSASPFATLGATLGAQSPFGTPKASPPSSVAGGSGSQGGLGLFGGSGFGGFGQKAPTSGFGVLAAKPFANVISSAPKPLAGSKAAKPFGAPEDYSEEEGSDEEGEDDEESGDDEKEKKEKEPKAAKSEVFQETEVVTGEENEITICHFRAKTYHFDKSASAWKERGVGTLKLLASKLDLDDWDNQVASMKRKFRLVMRADAVHKVILNVPLTEDMIATYGDQGKLPSGNSFRLLGLENGELSTLLIKLRNPTDSRMLYTHILECLLGHEAASKKIEEEAV